MSDTENENQSRSRLRSPRPESSLSTARRRHCQTEYQRTYRQRRQESINSMNASIRNFQASQNDQLQSVPQAIQPVELIENEANMDLHLNSDNNIAGTENVYENQELTSAVSSSIADSQNLGHHHDHDESVYVEQEEFFYQDEYANVEPLFDQQNIDENNITEELVLDDEITVISNRDDVLKKNLCRTFIQNKATFALMRGVLKNCRDYGAQVPLSPVTLFKRPQRPNIIPIGNSGHYLHFGFKHGLEHISKILPSAISNPNVTLDISWDGVPLTKSSNNSLWLICAGIVNVFVNPFVIGAFVGTTKPEVLSQFFEPMLTDLLTIETEGIYIGQRRVSINVRLFTTDTPARQMGTGTKGHASKNGCAFCDQIGISIERHMVYSSIAGVPRTHLSFIDKTDPDHHK